MAFKAYIVGIPSIPTITEVNIRDEANKTATLLFKTPVGIGDLEVIEVKIDSANEAQSGKVFHWLKLTFPDGKQGWCRDDLLELVGDGQQFGYGQVGTRTLGFNLIRQQVSAAPSAPAAPAPTAPAAPIASAPAAPIASAPSTPAPSAPASTSGPGMIICMSQGGANVRPGPGTTTGNPVMRIDFKAEATILGVDKSRDPNDPFTWINIDYKGQKGWIREDFVRYKGGYEQFKLAFADMYANPAQDSWWIRDFNLDPNFNPVLHHGWDHAGNVGAPIIGGPKGGLVIKVAQCQKCGASGASSVAQGFSVSDSRVLSDPGWNFGYGHFVNVRYHHDLLPASTQKRLADQGKAGWHIFVNHGHLHQIDIQPDLEFGPNAQIGKLGNSGNSSGAHLHLEVRAHPDANEKDWARMKAGLMSPAILFLR